MSNNLTQQIFHSKSRLRLADDLKSDIQSQCPSVSLSIAQLLHICFEKSVCTGYLIMIVKQ